MNTDIRTLCDNYLEDLNKMNKALVWDSNIGNPIYTSIILSYKKRFDAEHFKYCGKILKSHEGIFSDFRSYSNLATITTLACAADPEIKMQQLSDTYKMLKEDFLKSSYLPVASIILNELSDNKVKQTEIVNRARNIYKRLKSNHMFLLDKSQSPYFLSLALLEKSDDTIVNEIEECVTILKGITSKQYALNVAIVLTTNPGTPEEKCRKFINLYNSLLDKNIKFRKDHFLSVLAILSTLDISNEQLAIDMKEVINYLRGHKPYTNLFGYGKKDCYVHSAGLLCTYYNSAEGECIALTNTITAIIAYETAVMAAIAASSAAAASAASC